MISGPGGDLWVAVNPNYDSSTAGIECAPFGANNAIHELQGLLFLHTAVEGSECWPRVAGVLLDITLPERLMKKLIVFDLDGTLAQSKARSMKKWRRSFAGSSTSSRWR